MKVVFYPLEIVDIVTRKFREMLLKGTVAEGEYYGGNSGAYLRGKLAIPVTSGGAGIFSLLAYQKYVGRKTHVIIQSNTMRALYTIPKLLDMNILIADSSYEDFLAMNMNSLFSKVENLDSKERAVVVYSVIGGYLSESFFEIEEFCRSKHIPLIVDAAHAHYLDKMLMQGYCDFAFSFYATKILPTGEGGLIATCDEAVYDWVLKFLMYDRFENKLQVGLNLRASEFISFFIYMLMTDPSVKKFFCDDRIKIAEHYRKICLDNKVQFLDPTRASEYNGYKFVVLDNIEAVKQKDTELTKYQPTSGVFDTDVCGKKGTLPHWCPPTYRSLYDEFFS